MKVCKICEKRGVKFGTNALTCNTCLYHINILFQEGYTTDDAKYKVSFGTDKESKIRYWTERLKKDEKC